MKAQTSVDAEEEGDRQVNKWDPNQFVSQSGRDKHSAISGAAL